LGALVSAATIVVGCLGAGVAFWLLPASIDIVAWPPAGPVRVALFAPLFKLWAALGAGLVATAALLFVGSRSAPARAKRAQIVAPLWLLWLWTVPYWPWLPDRAPALLILAGPVRWLMVAAAVVGVVTAWARSPGYRITVPGRGTIFAVTLALYCGLGMRSLATVGPGGDEPHYLIITHSLMVDRDVKIENNHARGDYRAFWGGDLRPDYLVRGQNGEIYSLHSPGISALVLPGYAVAGVWGAVLTICLVAALAALAVFDVAFLLGGPAIALLTWLCVCLTVPFVPHTWMIYPEIAGAAIVAWAVRWLVDLYVVSGSSGTHEGHDAGDAHSNVGSGPSTARPEPFDSPLILSMSKDERLAQDRPVEGRALRAGYRRITTWIWRGACLGFLPWLHTKFIVFLAMLTVFLLWRLRSRLRDAAALLLPIGLFSMAWLAYFYVIYGSIDPQVAYGAYTAANVRFENLPRSLLGFLIDQKFGLLVYSPVYLLSLAGMWRLLRDRAWRGFALALATTAIPYIISSARLYMWWGGSSAPARFLVPVLPLMAPPIAAALMAVRSQVGRATAASWIAFAVLVAAVGVVVPERLFLLSDPHGIARFLDAFQGSAPMADALPTFTEENWRAPMARAVPWIVAAAAALGLAALIAARARRVRTFWIVVVEAVVFIVTGSVISATPASPARAASILRGQVELMAAFDPDRLRAWDYGTSAKLDPDSLLRATSLAITVQPSRGAVDPQGRVTAQLALPPGRYEGRVWFQGQREHAGDLLLSVRRGDVLARVSGPLPNPATIAFDLPVRVGFWVRLSELAAARDVQRVEIAPLSIVPKSRRIDVQPRAIEAISGRPNAYIVYVNDETYPEGGVFWTRAANRGEVLVAPAGASQIVLTLHVGPISGVVGLTVAGRNLDTPMGPNETRQVSIDVPAGAGLVPISTQAPAWFRPASVDAKSTDTRALGCQVRVELR
jgi:hypothetical protein